MFNTYAQALNNQRIAQNQLNNPNAQSDFQKQWDEGVNNFLKDWRTQAQASLLATDPKYKQLYNADQQATKTWGNMFAASPQTFGRTWEQNQASYNALKPYEQAQQRAAGAFGGYEKQMLDPQENMLKRLFGLIQQGALNNPQMLSGFFTPGAIGGSGGSATGAPGQYNPAIGLNPNFAGGLLNPASTYARFQQNANNFVR